MIKNEPYYYDETECTVEDATEWIEAKQIDIYRHPFNYNFIKLTFDIGLKCPIGKTGEAAIFINNEEKPRATIKHDSPLYDVKHVEIDTYNLPYTKNTITLALKGSITNTQYKITVLRIYTLYEIIGELTPIAVMSEIL